MVFFLFKKNPVVRLFSSFTNYELALYPFCQHCSTKILTYAIFLIRRIRRKSFSVLLKIPSVKIQIFRDRSFTYFLNYFFVKCLEILTTGSLKIGKFRQKQSVSIFRATAHALQLTGFFNEEKIKNCWFRCVVKPWPNGDASWRKLKTWVNLRLCLARACVHLRWLAMTCAHFGRDHICTQVDASFSPFGHPTQVNASWVTSINPLLANKIEDRLP